MKNRQLLFDGATVKNVAPWDLDSNVGWTVMGDQDTAGVDLLASRIPWFFRGLRDRGGNVAGMPWSIIANDKEIANSGEWSLKRPPELEFIQNPRRLLNQIEQSLIVAGKAYVSLDCNPSGYVKKMRYLNPSSIEEKRDKDTGEITHYERRVNNKIIKLTRADQPPEKGLAQCLAIYDADYMTEDGPGKSSAGLAALTAAGVLYEYDRFVTGFFQRGAIKASILSVEQTTTGELKRLENWWSDLVTGVKNAWSSFILQGKGITPVVIGEGMEGLKDNDLSTQRRQDIATALGIPESRMWSAAANYATRKEDELAYYRGTIIPECDLISEAFNEQLFNEWHNLDMMHLEFHPETLDVFQEDEADRSGSLNQLTTAGVPLRLAMEILGYDLTDEQWEMLEEDQAEEAPVNPNPAPIIPAPEMPTEPAPIEQPEPMPEELPAMNNQDRIASIRGMLKNWERKAKHGLKLAGSADIPWDTDLLPDELCNEIRASLAVCETAEQVKGVFSAVEIPEVEVVTPGENMAHELKRANDLLEMLWHERVEVVEPIKSEPQPAPTINVNIANQMPGQEAPTVKVEPTVINLPEPVINVTVQPAPLGVEIQPAVAPVTVENNINVPSSQSAKVIRDNQGKITRLEAE